MLIAISYKTLSRWKYNLAGFHFTSEALSLEVTFQISARLAQSVEHETLNLRVVGSSPTLGEHFIMKNIIFVLAM